MRLHPWLVLSLAAIPALLQASSAQAAVAPVVHGVLEGRQSGSVDDRPSLTIVGSSLTKFTSFALQLPDGTDAGAVTLVVKSKFMLVLVLPAAIQPGDYNLMLATGKVSAPVWTEHPVTITLGGPKPGTVTLDHLVGTLQTDLGDADSLGGHGASFFQDASNLIAGTLSLSRFSAYDDLTAEAKIGTAAGTVAAGDHLHDGRYFTETELSAAGTLNAAGNPVDWTKLKGVPAGLADGVDGDTTYSAGTGLGLSGTVFSLTYGGTAGDFGSATSAARSDHIHDGRYFTETEVNGAGTINTAANPLEWTKLKNVPAGFADGVDGDTTYAAGAGLTLTGTTFAANFLATGGNNGTTSNPARSDHNHTSLTGALTVTNGLTVTGSVAGNLFNSTNTNTAAGASGVYGAASYTGSGTRYGVYGWGAGTSGVGVFGGGYIGVQGSGGAYGVYGSGSSYGVYAIGSASGAEGLYASAGTGGYGVLADSDFIGVRGNGSSYGLYGSGGTYGVYGTGSTYGAYGSGSTYGVYGYSSSNYGVYGYSGAAYYGVFCSGHSYTSGNIYAGGTKYFVQRHPTQPDTAITYICLEGGEAGTYCRGRGQLVNGEARIELPEHFPLVTSPDGITAQVTPTGNCRGLYVAEQNNRFIVVRELNGGTGSATFNWTVNGIRSGYENIEVVTKDPKILSAIAEGENPTPPPATQEPR